MAIQGVFANEIDFITKTTVLGIFDFRSFPNLAMLVFESEWAKLLRQAISAITWPPDQFL